MKSVKAKLFVGYISTIFFILLLLSTISIYFFQLNQETKNFEFNESINTQVEEFILNNSLSALNGIEKEIKLKSLLLIIMKNNKVVFSNKSQHKTENILEELDEEFRKENFAKKYEEKGYIEAEDYLFVTTLIDKGNSEYEFFLGMKEDELEEDLEDIVHLVILSNIILFLILAISGYLLIHKTIKPLKMILSDLKTLRTNQSLSLRLKKQDTKDEFEELTTCFNEMLDGIEKSVENIKQFSSDASHELKTPLTIIQGEIELCKQGQSTKEDLIQTIDKIEFQQKNLQDIIQNFLLLSRLDKEVFENKTAVLDKVLFESIELHLAKIETKSLELKVDIEEELSVSFDEKYLSVVVNNLLSNAIKYTLEGFVGIRAYKKGNYIFVEVSDSGIGIKKEDRDKIFERFFRVDKVRTDMKMGVGLGLAIVKNICDRFSCNIKVKSELNKGTVFTLKINKAKNE